MWRVAAAVLLALVCAGTVGCKAVGLAPEERDPEAVKIDPDERREPPRVVVRHVLLAHADAGIPGVTRDLAKAERVARNVHAAALEGRPFDELIRLYTDDAGSQGEITLLNWGVSRTSPDELERGKLVRDFHEACFAMEVGEIRLVPYDEKSSPYGWHVIQRVE